MEEFSADKMIVECTERWLPPVIADCEIVLSKTGMVIKNRSQYCLWYPGIEKDYDLSCPGITG